MLLKIISIRKKWIKNQNNVVIYIYQFGKHTHTKVNPPSVGKGKEQWKFLHIVGLCENFLNV